MNQILKKTFAGLCLISSLLLTPSAALSAPTATIFSLATGVAGVTTGRLSGGGSSLDRPEKLSQSASNRNFAAQSFTPSVTEPYTFGVGGSGFDAVLVLYNGPFNPSSPQTNAMDVNDDGFTQAPAGVTVTPCGATTGNCPQLTQTLTAGTTYTVVVTTIDDVDIPIVPVDFYVYGEPVTVGAAPVISAPTVTADRKSVV